MYTSICYIAKHIYIIYIGISKFISLQYNITYIYKFIYRQIKIIEMAINL